MTVVPSATSSGSSARASDLQLRRAPAARRTAAREGARSRRSAGPRWSAASRLRKTSSIETRQQQRQANERASAAGQRDEQRRDHRSDGESRHRHALEQPEDAAERIRRSEPLEQRASGDVEHGSAGAGRPRAAPAPRSWTRRRRSPRGQRPRRRGRRRGAAPAGCGRRAPPWPRTPSTPPAPNAAFR